MRGHPIDIELAYRTVLSARSMEVSMEVSHSTYDADGGVSNECQLLSNGILL